MKKEPTQKQKDRCLRRLTKTLSQCPLLPKGWQREYNKKHKQFDWPTDVRKILTGMRKEISRIDKCRFWDNQPQFDNEVFASMCVDSLECYAYRLTQLFKDHGFGYKDGEKYTLVCSHGEKKGNDAQA